MSKVLSPAELSALRESQPGLALFDIRESAEFESGHIRGATSLPRRMIELRATTLVPVLSTPIVVYGDDSPRAGFAAERLEQLGYKDVAVLSGGFAAWEAAGLKTSHGTNVPSKAFGEKVAHEPLASIEPADLHSRMAAGEQFTIVDVRTPGEYGSGSIPGAINAEGVELVLRAPDLARVGNPIVVTCAGRTRSIIAGRTIGEMGVGPVYRLDNGTMGWMLAGHELSAGTATASMPSPDSVESAESFGARLRNEANIPLIGVSELLSLKERSAEDTLYLFDVRAVSEYEAGHVPGAEALPGGQAIQRADDFIPVRNGTVVLICDGTARSSVTAYWLSRLGYLDARVLDGGVVAWRTAGQPLENGRTRPKALGVQQAREQVQPIDPAELQKLMSVGGVSVIDVGVSTAYKSGHVPGAQWLPRGWLEQRIPGVSADLNAPIAVTCANGQQSLFAAARLQEIGYTNVRWLEGGLEAWKTSGQPVELGPEELDGGDVVLPPYAKGRKGMMEYLRWETALVPESTPRA